MARHSLTHCEHLKYKQVGGESSVLQIFQSQKKFQAPLAPNLPVLTHVPDRPYTRPADSASRTFAEIHV